MKKVPFLLLVVLLTLPFTEVRCTFGSKAKAGTISREVMPEVTVPIAPAGTAFPHSEMFRSGRPGRGNRNDNMTTASHKG